MERLRGNLARTSRVCVVAYNPYLRLLYWLPVGIAISVVLIDRLLQLDRGFQAAVLTMIILPPPFVIPLFIPEADKPNRTYVVNTLSLATVVTLFAFALVTIIYPP